MKVCSNQKISRLIGWLIFLCIVLFCFNAVSATMQRKESRVEYKDFYKNKNKIDVLFMGSSHVLYSILPMELWSEYGIASYNMGEAQSTIPEIYWTLKNSLDYQKPKLVVVDLYNLEREEKVVEAKYLHNYTDTLPLSVNKVNMVYDLLPPMERPEYLFDFSLYHNRWTELEEKDFYAEPSIEKGADTTVMEIYPTEGPDLAVDKHEYNNLQTLGTEYISKIVELCKQKDCQLLFIYMPYGQADETVLKNANYGYILSEKYGIPYLNLMYETGLVDYRIDCSDANSHLNPAGSKKVTSFLGDYIVHNYDIPNHKNDENYSNWHDDEKRYSELKKQRLHQASQLDRYLMLLNDKQMNAEIEVGSSCMITDTEKQLISALEENGAGIHDSVNDTVTIQVTDLESNQIIDTALFRDNGDGLYKMSE